MTIVYKILSIVLLLPIIFVNLSVGLAGACPAKSGGQTMVCCPKIVVSCERTEVKFSKLSCCCRLSSGTKSAPMLPYSAEPPSKTEKEIVKTLSPSNDDFKNACLSTPRFELFRQSKFLTHLKIYTFVSSYLI